jgi:hypothetical protein
LLELSATTIDGGALFGRSLRRALRLRMEVKGSE